MTRPWTCLGHGRSVGRERGKEWGDGIEGSGRGALIPSRRCRREGAAATKPL